MSFNIQDFISKVIASQVSFPQVSFCQDLSSHNLSSQTGIEKVDQDGELQMFCYKQGTNMDNSNFERDCRGVVLDSDDKVVMKTFGYTPEFEDKDLVSFLHFLMSNGITYLNQCMFFESEEGTLIRVFNHNGKWYNSTHRKLDANKSKWSSRESFGTIFTNSIYNAYNKFSDFRQFVSMETTDASQVLEKFLSNLDTSKVHTFLISNTEENRIVCQAPLENQVKYTGSFSPDGKEFSFLPIPLPTPTRRSFSHIMQVGAFVSSIDYNYLQGLLVVTPNLQTCKIVNQSYKYFASLRDNCPSVKFRYLEVRTNRTIDSHFRSLYPRFEREFIEIEEDILKIALKIHQSYIARFIRKEYARVTPTEYQIIRDCHGQHIANRNIKVTFEKILESVNSQTPVFLNRLLKEFRNPPKFDEPISSEPTFEVPKFDEPISFKPMTNIKMALLKTVVSEPEQFVPDEEFTTCLSNLDEEERKNVIMERIFPVVSYLFEEEYAVKIVVELFKNSSAELMGMLQSRELLKISATDIFNKFEKEEYCF